MAKKHTNIGQNRGFRSIKSKFLNQSTSNLGLSFMGARGVAATKSFRFVLYVCGPFEPGRSQGGPFWPRLAPIWKGHGPIGPCLPNPGCSSTIINYIAQALISIIRCLLSSIMDLARRPKMPTGGHVCPLVVHSGNQVTGSKLYQFRSNFTIFEW